MAALHPTKPRYAKALEATLKMKDSPEMTVDAAPMNHVTSGKASCMLCGYAIKYTAADFDPTMTFGFLKPGLDLAERRVIHQYHASCYKHLLACGVGCVESIHEGEGPCGGCYRHMTKKE